MQSLRRSSRLLIRSGFLRRCLVVGSLGLLLGACAMVARQAMDDQFGPAQVRDRTISANDSSPEYHRDVKAILDKRCVACHACYDAPCQLQLGSYEGIDRGASLSTVYDSSRLLASSPSRLFVDEKFTEAWRGQGFFPVLNERDQSPANNFSASVLARMLALKENNPPSDSPLLPADMSIGTSDSYVCVRPERFDDFAREHPQWGMPYGLPAIADSELRILKDWISTGASVRPPPPLGDADLAKVAQWEQFFNQPPLKARLMSRYIFEHLFLAHFYFDDEKPAESAPFFKLVRSRTPPGQPIEIIATRRPYDGVGEKPFYYRLWRERTTVTAKNHMPYALNAARMARWQQLFLNTNVVVEKLPSYAVHVAADPFIAFKDIPVDSRYRFMLDEAQFSIMSFIKGPVCRGQVAVNVINDRFWVYFINPSHPSIVRGTKLIDASGDTMRLPIEEGSNASPLRVWTKYAALEKQRVRNKEKFLMEEFVEREHINLDLIWDGDGHNSNAALTIFRHADNATVVKGLVGAHPKTAWVIDYTLLERIHYLLVAGYDVYGNVGHNVNSRLYMDFLRMDGEFSFLAYLPQALRTKERDSWYRNAHLEVEDFIRFDRESFSAPSMVEYQTDNPKAELFEKLAVRLAGVADDSNKLQTAGFPPAELKLLEKLATLRGRAVSHLPEFSYLTILSGAKSRTVSLIKNTGLSNVAYLFGEDGRRRPSEDSLTVAASMIGAYPNAFFRVDSTDLEDFVEAVSQLESGASYAALADRFAIRRTNPEFWPHSDLLHDHFVRNQPLEFGVMDYNRLENR